MHPHQAFSQNTFVRKASQHVRRFQADVEREPWKLEHEQAMRCYALQEALTRGVWLFNTLVDLDMALRSNLVKDPARTDKITTETLSAMTTLMRWWLKPCERVAAEIRLMERRGFEVAHAAEFRKCYQEAQWMVDDNPFDHEAFVEAKDQAVDQLRAGDVE